MTGLIKVIHYKAVEELSVRGPEGDLLGFNQASKAKEKDRNRGKRTDITRGSSYC